MEPRRVLLIAQLDASANSVKPLEIQRYLRERGHEVRLVDTYRLSRASPEPGSPLRRLPAPRPTCFALWLTEAASLLLTRRWAFGRRCLSYRLLVAEHRLRGAILGAALRLDDVDLVICETPYDSGVLSRAGRAATWYDAPAPWADELYYEGRLTDRQRERLRGRERRVLEGAGYVSFHWPSYTRYAVEHYGISGANLRALDFGCTPSARRARFADPPRIVYLGSADARFQNPGLLARMAARYPYIDVYGNSPPDPRLGLNYRGYAQSLDVLSEYQLGLVTCSTDPLRRDGFSSKHLHYLAYGLPALVPEWRRLDSLRGSVSYSEENFLATVDSLRDPVRWQALSDEASAQAQRLSWDRTLRPLDGVLREVGRQADAGSRRARSRVRMPNLPS